jgi:cardiolipin synthase
MLVRRCIIGTLSLPALPRCASSLHCALAAAFSTQPPRLPPAPHPPPASSAAAHRVLSGQDRIYTVPNLLTVIRLLLSPVIGHQVLCGDAQLAAGLFLLAGSLDVADGWVARAFNQTSVLGSYLDPLADKVLLACTAIPLAALGALPLPLVVLWAGRDALLLAGGFQMRAAARPPGVAFFDSSHASVPVVEPSTVSKVNTALQVGAVALVLCGPPLLGGVPSGVLAAVYAASAATTVASGRDYFRQYKEMMAALRVGGKGP